MNESDLRAFDWHIINSKTRTGVSEQVKGRSKISVTEIEALNNWVVRGGMTGGVPDSAKISSCCVVCCK
jgi:hypothetical protein